MPSQTVLTCSKVTKQVFPNPKPPLKVIPGQGLNIQNAKLIET